MAEAHDPYAILVPKSCCSRLRSPASCRATANGWSDGRPTSAGAASPADVIVAWSGLGYNRRAVSLHRCAQTVVELGRLPPGSGRAAEAPGIGPYTAAPWPVLPSAPRSRRRTPTPTGCWSAHSAQRSTCPRRSGIQWNQALFDLGREICIARRPRCERCPLARGVPFSRPHVRAVAKTVTLRGIVSPAAQHASARGSPQPASLPLHQVDAEVLVSLQADGLVRDQTTTPARDSRPC